MQKDVTKALSNIIRRQLKTSLNPWRIYNQFGSSVVVTRLITLAGVGFTGNTNKGSCIIYRVMLVMFGVSGAREITSPSPTLHLPSASPPPELSLPQVLFLLLAA